MKGRSHVVEMLGALKVEAKKRRSVEGGERSELFGGRRVSSSVGAHSYRFLQRGSGKRVRYLEAVHVLTDRVEIPGAITAVGEKGRIEITVGTDLGVNVPFATLVQDDAFLIEALRDRLKAAQNRQLPFNWGMVDDLLSPARWTSAAASSAGPLKGEPSLNPEQATAVRAMGMPGVTVIWGPPGTGKTTVLAAGTRRGFDDGHRIFLLAHTNVAVDNLLERFLDELGDRSLPDGMILRVGDLASDSLRDRFGDAVSFPAVVARRRAPLEEDLDRLGRAIAGARKTLRTTEDLSEDDRQKTAADLDRLEREAHDLEREYERLPGQILEEAAVVATTIHRAYLPGNLSGQADLVVVDEASMVPLPMAVWAAGLARTAVAFAGDPKQLGVITKSRARSVRRWVTASVFHVPTSGPTKPQPLLLRRQYRMHPEIAGLLNEISYRPGALITPGSIIQRKPPRLGVLKPGVTLLDTSELGVKTVIPRGTHTRVNDVHSRLVSGLLTAVLQPGGDTTAAVITPYRGQARRIRRDMPRWLKSVVSVDTVHRFQGDERPLIILDLVDAPGARVSKFMRAKGFRDDGARLLTVGLSRAQFALVILANVEYLASSTPANSFVRRLLTYAGEHASVIDPALLSRPLRPNRGVHRRSASRTKRHRVV